MSDELIPQLPPEALALLDDPRVADMKYLGPRAPRAERVLQPASPPVAGESKFLLLSIVPQQGILSETDWLNTVPTAASLAYRGLGALRAEQQRFLTEQKKPAVLPGVWLSSGVIVASRAIIEILRAHDPDAIDTVAIDWTFEGGEKAEGYAFLYVRRVVQAYDWSRSAVLVEHDSKHKYIAGLGMARALRRELAAGVHIFRDAYALQDVFVSRELGAHLARLGLPEVYLLDPATMRTAKV
jgi:hypothetical protein